MHWEALRRSRIAAAVVREHRTPMKEDMTAAAASAELHRALVRRRVEVGTEPELVQRCTADTMVAVAEAEQEPHSPYRSRRLRTRAALVQEDTRSRMAEEGALASTKERKTTEAAAASIASHAWMAAAWAAGPPWQPTQRMAQESVRCIDWILACRRDSSASLAPNRREIETQLRDTQSNTRERCECMLSLE